jgi:hypothetical protein
MNNRRDFLKLTGLTGLGLLGAPILPGFARPQKDNSEPIPAGNMFEEDAASPDAVLEPAPEWMQNADMFSSAPWYVAAGKSSGENAVWRAYDMEFRDVPVKQKVRIASANVLKEISAKVPVVKNGTLDGAALKGVAMISHAPVSELAFKQAHEQGFRIIPYVHFTDIHTYYADQDIFHFEHPEVLLRNHDGKWAHLPMDNSERFNRFLTCANNPVYCKLSLDYIKKLMDWGADGLFIDNVFNRQECTAAKVKHTSPEFSPYVHDHIYPEATHNYAFNRFLESVRKLVKSYGADKVVVLNSGIGTEFQKNGDCCMWESFIFSWSWKGRSPEHTWAQIKEKAKKNEWYKRGGCRITALSTINPAEKGSKNDAFWAFTAARLVDFIWWAELGGTRAEILYNTHLGQPLTEITEEADVAFRFYAKAILVLNNSSNDRLLTLAVPVAFSGGHVTDIYSGARLIRKKNKLTVSIPANCARVYVK